MRLGDIRKKRMPRRRMKRRGPKYWVLTVTAMGALVAFSAGRSRAVTVRYVRADDAAVVEAQQTRRFEIPSGTLGEVLASFEKLTGVRVEVQDEKMRDLASPGVSGVYSTEQALKHLLTGTGVSYTFANARLIRLDIRAQAETVEVKDNGALQPSLPMYTEPILDTPQTITVIPKAIIEQQAATTLQRCAPQCSRLNDDRRRRRRSRGRQSDAARFQCAQRRLR